MGKEICSEREMGMNGSFDQEKMGHRDNWDSWLKLVF